MNDSLPKRGGMRWLVLIPVLIIVGAWGYAELALHWSYSAGERVGTLQKLSSKGWVCKTNEGEIAMYIVSGVSPQLWDFTVRDDAVAAQ
ncbi:MAG: hypothetical protein ABUL58_03795, partial [Steroidobacter sp.]